MSPGVELTEAEARVQRKGLKILARMIARRYLEDIANEERRCGAGTDDRPAARRQPEGEAE